MDLRTVLEALGPICTPAGSPDLDLISDVTVTRASTVREALNRRSTA